MHHKKSPKNIALTYKCFSLLSIHRNIRQASAHIHADPGKKKCSCDNKLTTTTNAKQHQIIASKKLLSYTLTHTHTHTHTISLHWLGPSASGSPQWNFHAAIWRSIGDRDLLSRLDVPLEKTRKLEHIGFCKSEEKKLLDLATALAAADCKSLQEKKPLCSWIGLSTSVCVVQYLCQSSAEQVSEWSCAGVDPYSLRRYYEGNRGNGAVKLTTNFRKTTYCERKGHCYCKENNENNTAVMQCIFWLSECLNVYLCTLYVHTLYSRYIFSVSHW